MHFHWNIISCPCQTSYKIDLCRLTNSENGIGFRLGHCELSHFSFPDLAIHTHCFNSEALTFTLSMIQNGNFVHYFQNCFAKCYCIFIFNVLGNKKLIFSKKIAIHYAFIIFDRMEMCTSAEAALVL